MSETITFETLCKNLDDVIVIKEGIEAYAKCPWCGKAPRDDRGREARHFHFGRFGNFEYGKCFVCGENGGYVSIYRRVTGEDVEYIPSKERETIQQKKPAPFWQTYASMLLASYERHPQKLALWRKYKPVNDSVLGTYRFGVGILPYTLTHAPTGAEYTFMPTLDRGEHDTLVTSTETGVERWMIDTEISLLHKALTGRDGLPVQHSERLIVPLLDDKSGWLVGLRGRSLRATGSRYKWLSATGSISPLFGLQHVCEGATVVLGENYVDAAMVGQYMPDMRGIALGTARTIREEEIERLKAKRPAMVLVALDNDLAGQARGATRRKLEEEYKAEHGREAPAPLHGFRCVNALRQAGIEAVPFDWERFGAPPKSGVDWALINGWD